MDVNSLLAVISIVLAIGIAILAFWSSRGVARGKRNSIKLEELEFKISSLQCAVRSETHITDAIAGALHCLHQRQTVITSMFDPLVEDSFLLDKEHKEYIDAEKYLTELGLFSDDKDRRISAQRSLAHFGGDPKSLMLMKMIEKGELGVRDTEILNQIVVLEKRIETIFRSHQNWPGRPGGGEF